MIKKIGFKGSKFLTNNWVVTLSATLVGVFAALYLNELVASNKLKNQKVIATENILAEIKLNEERIDKALDKHIVLLDMINLVVNYYDEENENFIAPSDSISKFDLKYPNLFVVEDSTFISEGIYDYNGELYMDFSTPQFEITTVAWNTLKNSGITTAYKFECLMYLQGLYNLTDEISSKNKQLFNYVTNSNEEDGKMRTLMGDLKILVDFEKSYLKILKLKENELQHRD